MPIIEYFPGPIFLANSVCIDHPKYFVITDHDSVVPLIHHPSTVCNIPLHSSWKMGLWATLARSVRQFFQSLISCDISRVSHGQEVRYHIRTLTIQRSCLPQPLFGVSSIMGKCLPTLTLYMYMGDTKSFTRQLL